LASLVAWHRGAGLSRRLWRGDGRHGTASARGNQRAPTRAV